ncbi:Hypothetical_protein [Hexamita inflata]|uniref:Hypothetical_protein n=1 Tax=Hexamita inflata TaxID=28002 RepID=A0AA86TEX1_9EUKA|nr:Hypothetical protein HINF_LOCUS3435 [Hexamita inflata]
MQWYITSLRRGLHFRFQGAGQLAYKGVGHQITPLQAVINSDKNHCLSPQQILIYIGHISLFFISNSVILVSLTIQKVQTIICCHQLRTRKIIFEMAHTYQEDIVI